MVLSCSCANIIVPSLFLYFSVLMGSGFFRIMLLKYFLCKISCSFFALSPYTRWRASCYCSLWNYFYVVGDWYVFPCFPSFLEGKIYRFHWFTDSSTWDLFFWFPSKLPAWLLKSIDRKSHSTKLPTSDLLMPPAATFHNQVWLLAAVHLLIFCKGIAPPAHTEFVVDSNSELRLCCIVANVLFPILYLYIWFLLHQNVVAWNLASAVEFLLPCSWQLVCFSLLQIASSTDMTACEAVLWTRAENWTRLDIILDK